MASLPDRPRPLRALLMRPLLIRLALALLIGLVPVGRIAHALGHQADGQSQKHGHHQGGQGCATCAAYVPIGAGLVGAAFSVPVVTTPIERVVVAPLASWQHSPAPYSSRAPPASSSLHR